MPSPTTGSTPNTLATIRLSGQLSKSEARMRTAMKKVILAVTLIAALATLGTAQNASIGESVIFRGRAPVTSSSFHSIQPPKAPSYCKPCLWYSGDFDPNNHNADGLANENDQLVADSHVYSPWKVKGTTTVVSGAFVNSLDIAGAGIDNPTPWEIRKGIHDGSCGTLVKRGKAKSTDTPTGRRYIGFDEYTHRVRFKAVALKAGIYWQNVTPQCFHNSVCPNAKYFESTEDDDPWPLNHVGTKNVLHKAIWNSTTYGIYCANTQTSFSTGYPQFSAGVLGNK